MPAQASKFDSVSSTGFLQIVADKSHDLIVKVFDIKGKKAKTFNTADLESQDLVLYLKDLEAGKYILNAFSRGNFIKSIRYFKQ